MRHKRSEPLLVPSIRPDAAFVAASIVVGPSGPRPPTRSHEAAPGRPAPGTLDVDVDGSDGRGPRRPAPRPESAAQRPPARWPPASATASLNGLLVLACIVLIILAYTAMGPSSSSSSPTTRTSTAKYGVVQSTVSAAATSSPPTSSTSASGRADGHPHLRHASTSTRGSCCATLDPRAAEVTLEQAKARCSRPKPSLAKLEETDGETSAGEGSSGAGATASTASARHIESTTGGRPTRPTPRAERRDAHQHRKPAPRRPRHTTTPTTTTTPSTTRHELDQALQRIRQSSSSRAPKARLPSRRK